MIQKVQVWIYGLNRGGELQFLLLKTGPTRGEFWQPVTGGVEEGESLDTAANREAVEETGLTFISKPFALSSFEFEVRGARVSEHGFSLEAATHSVGQRIRLDPREHIDFKWVSSDEALKMTHFESNREILRELLVELGKKQLN